MSQANGNWSQGPINCGSPNKLAGKSPASFMVSKLWLDFPAMWTTRGYFLFWQTTSASSFIPVAFLYSVLFFLGRLGRFWEAFRLHPGGITASMGGRCWTRSAMRRLQQSLIASLRVRRAWAESGSLAESPEVGRSAQVTNVLFDLFWTSRGLRSTNSEKFTARRGTSVSLGQTATKVTVAQNSWNNLESLENIIYKCIST
jgi:hypothetical protein